MADYYSGYAASAEPTETSIELLESSQTIAEKDAQDIERVKNEVAKLKERIAQFDRQLRDLKAHGSISDDNVRQKEETEKLLQSTTNMLKSIQELAEQRAKHVNVVRRFHADMYKLIYDSVRDDLKKAKDDLVDSIKSGIYTTVIARFNPYDTNLVAYHAYRNEYLTMVGDNTQHKDAHKYALECLDKVMHKTVIERVKEKANTWFQDFIESLNKTAEEPVTPVPQPSTAEYTANPVFGLSRSPGLEPSVQWEPQSSITMQALDEGMAPDQVPTESIAVGPDEPMMRDQPEPKQVTWDTRLGEELPGVAGGKEAKEGLPIITPSNSTKFDPKQVWALRDLIDVKINSRLESGTIMRKVKEGTTISTVNALIERINLIHAMINDKEDRPSTQWKGYAGRGKIILNNLEMLKPFDMPVYTTLLSYYTLDYLLRITHDIQVRELGAFASVDTMKIREPFVDITPEQRDIIATETGIYVKLGINEAGYPTIHNLHIEGFEKLKGLVFTPKSIPYNRIKIENDETVNILNRYFDIIINVIEADKLTKKDSEGNEIANGVLRETLSLIDKHINRNGINYNAKMIKSTVAQKYDPSTNVLKLLTYKA